jgi:hypothetical protein
LGQVITTYKGYNMKKIIVTFIIIISAFSACRDEDTIRLPKFKNAPNFRIQMIPQFSFFNFEDLENAKLVWDVFSQNYSEIESAEISFRYQKQGNPNCANRGCLGPFVLKTYTKSQLSTAKGIIKGETFTLQQVVDLMGVNLNSIGGGDQFLFENKVTMTDGRVYPSLTVGTNDNVPPIFDQPGASYTASFNAIVGCPVPAPFLGKYKLEQLDGDVCWNAGSCAPGTNVDPIFKTGTVELTEVNPITRTFNLTYLGFTDRPFRLILLCGGALVPAQGSGLACSGNTITWQTNDDSGIAEFDPTDDSEIIIDFMDNATSACGGTPEYTRFKLTKED